MLYGPRPVLSALLGLAIALLPTPSAAAPTQTADYTVTFAATWSASTHPTSFPPNPHFSGLIGTTHDASTALWNLGELASPGIERMAETGSKSPLLTEIADAATAGGGDALLSGGPIFTSPGSVALDFEINLNHPLVSLVTMIAPSPDWFVGVSGLSLLENGEWAEELVVTLWPYDSGTDSGPNYTSGNQDTNPAELITQITTAPFDNAVPLGTFTFTRTDIPTAVGESSPRTRALLFQNAPNPFNPSTEIRYSLPAGAPVRLAIYDVAGREVITLVDEVQSAGAHTVQWNGLGKDGGRVASGVYLYQLRAGSFVERRRMTLVK